MKRFILMFAAFLSLSSYAQSFQEHKELTISRVRFVEGVSQKELYKRAEDWRIYQEDLDGKFNYATNDILSCIVEYNYDDSNCPNFGVSRLLVADGTSLYFKVAIECFDGKYISKIKGITVCWNPSMGRLYGENGELYPEYYTKGELKMGKKIVEYLYAKSDEIFDFIEEFMIPD